MSCQYYSKNGRCFEVFFPLFNFHRKLEMFKCARSSITRIQKEREGKWISWNELSNNLDEWTVIIFANIELPVKQVNPLLASLVTYVSVSLLRYITFHFVFNEIIVTVLLSWIIFLLLFGTFRACLFTILDLDNTLLRVLRFAISVLFSLLLYIKTMHLWQHITTNEMFY